MKKEAVDNQVEFTVSVDENGFLGEGSTENVGWSRGTGGSNFRGFPGFSRGPR